VVVVLGIVAMLAMNRFLTPNGLNFLMLLGFCASLVLAARSSPC
jgi:hypothetical protein